MKRYDLTSADDLVFIPCHLNTSQKIENTKKLIDHYNKNFFVLLGSHINIPEEVSSLADFSFIDKNNPITGVHDHFNTPSRIYCFVEVHGKTLIKNIPNHGYAHMLLMRNAYLLALGWNFKKFHHINYDVPINFCDSEKIKNHSKLLDEFDFVAYKWYNNINKVDANVFSFRLDYQNKNFVEMKTFADYDHSFFGFSTEEFLYQTFESSRKKIFDAENRIDENDSIGCIENEVMTYAHPYVSADISPIILFDDGQNLNLYFQNVTDNVQNITLEFNDEMFLRLDIQPGLFYIQYICQNNVTEGKLNIIVNGVLKNIIDVTQKYNHGFFE